MKNKNENEIEIEIVRVKVEIEMINHNSISCIGSSYGLVKFERTFVIFTV